jgi:hypothetical protein
MCTSSHHVVHRLCRSRELRTDQAPCFTQRISRPSGTMLPRFDHLLRYWRNIAPNVPSQIPQHLGNDPPFRRLDVPYPSVDSVIPCSDRPQPDSCCFEGVSDFASYLVAYRGFNGDHLPMVIPTKSSSAFRSPFSPRRSSVVRLHNSRRWHSSASRRASFGGLVRTLPSLATHLTSVFPHTDPISIGMASPQ